MLKLSLKWMAVATILTLSSGNYAWANELHARVLKLTEQKKFEQALILLSQESAALQKGYEHRFLRAKILSWAGQYEQAQAELDSLMAQSPDNADLQFVRGNLEYYQGNFRSAERYYQTVLNQYPSYQEARTALENVRKARSSAQQNAPKTWRIDSGVGLSDFNQDDLTAWNTQFLRVEYAPDTLAYHASADRYERFGTTNVQLKGGIADAVRGGWDWGVEAGFTPNALFRPKFSAGGRLGRAIDTKNGPVFYPNITYRYDDYEAGGIHNIQPSLMTYLENGIVLTGSLIGTVQDSEPDKFGWRVRGLVPASDKLDVNVGFAKAPEAINGIAVTTQSLFGGLTYAVRDDLDLHLNVARDDRENSYIRNSVNVGFTYKR